MEVVFGSTFVQLNEMPDEEATAVLKMTVDFAKFVKEPSGGIRDPMDPMGMCQACHACQPCQWAHFKGLDQRWERMICYDYDCLLCLSRGIGGVMVGGWVADFKG